MQPISDDTQVTQSGQPAPGQRPVALDWGRLVVLEPRLKALLAEAQAIAKNPKTRKRAAYAWYGWGASGAGLKGKLVALIGFERGWRPERYPENVVVDLFHWPERPKVEHEDDALLYSAAVVDLFYWPQRPKVERNEDDALLYSAAAYHVAYQKLYTTCGCCP